MAHPIQLSGDAMLGRKLRGAKGRRRYIASPGLIRAANTALLLQWPLLLSGEPGCGKSDFAWAAASALAAAQGKQAPHPPEEAEPFQGYVRSESRARDLLYHYDALRRFGDIHIGEKAAAANVRDYVRLEALGQALMSPRRCVVLIDEIDKAPRDLPNDLLRELEQGHFTIPEIPADNKRDPKAPHRDTVHPTDDGSAPPALHREMVRPKDVELPLIVITSNNERQLPDPFLRRCVFYHIPFPDPAQMRQIVDSHFAGEPPDDDLWGWASSIFEGLRGRPLQKRPSTVEFLGWLRTLMADNAPALRRRLRDVAQGITDASAADLHKLPWDIDEMALGCLIKLRDDYKTLGLAHR